MRIQTNIVHSVVIGSPAITISDGKAILHYFLITDFFLPCSITSLNEDWFSQFLQLKGFHSYTSYFSVVLLYFHFACFYLFINLVSFIFYLIPNRLRLYLIYRLIPIPMHIFFLIASGGPSRHTKHPQLHCHRSFPS